MKKHWCPKTGAPANIDTSISELSNVSNHASDINGSDLVLCRMPPTWGGLNVGNNNGGIINTGKNTSSDNQTKFSTQICIHKLLDQCQDWPYWPKNARPWTQCLSTQCLNQGYQDHLLKQDQSSRSQTDGTIESDIKRELVDNCIEITFQGIELTTSPCLLIIGDEVYSGNPNQARLSKLKSQNFYADIQCITSSY